MKLKSCGQLGPVRYWASMAKPSFTSPFSTQEISTIKQSGLRDHSCQYNANIVCDNWVLPHEQKQLHLLKIPRIWRLSFSLEIIPEWHFSAVTCEVFTISHMTINNGALNKVDFNITTYYPTRLLIPRDKNPLYSMYVSLSNLSWPLCPYVRSTFKF